MGKEENENFMTTTDKIRQTLPKRGEFPGMEAVPAVQRTGVRHFDIEKIFDCGQSFRFERVVHTPHEKEFSGVACGKWVSFAQDGDTLTVYNTDEAEFFRVWEHYLALDTDYDAVCEDILRHCPTPVMREAIQVGEGIRILRQEPWELTVSFLLSQNNNIPRIKKIIRTLSGECGAPISLQPGAAEHFNGDEALFSFPDAAPLAALGEDGLYAMKTGFRAKYLYDAACRYLSGGLALDETLADIGLEQAIGELCRVRGIGRKVASCILLFSGFHPDAFPVDVWMQRSLARDFAVLLERGADPCDVFGPYAGIAQQFLFYREKYCG